MAYLALYRKYRPRTFDEVVGQDSITRILKNQIQYHRVGHAYLFSGIRGTGKTSLAKIFAKAINCPNGKDGNPCNTCEICMNIDRSGVMDIMEIDGASNRGVDEIREIREKSKYLPSIGKYKVYIIDEVHMLTKEAFNALLKTLEEPPEHVVFILATTEPNKCPTTILSRCQRYEIKPIPKGLIILQMEKICKELGVYIEEEALDFIGSRGENSMRDALSLLDQIVDLKDEEGKVSFKELLEFTGMSEKNEINALIQGILENNSEKVLLTFRRLVERGKDSTLLMDQVIEYLREVLIVKTAGKVGKEILHCTPETFSDYEAMSEKLDYSDLYGMISHLIEEKNKLKYSSLQEIITEMAFLRLCLTEEDFNEGKVETALPRKKRTKRLPERIEEEIEESFEEEDYSEIIYEEPRVEAVLKERDTKSSLEQDKSFAISEKREPEKVTLPIPELEKVKLSENSEKSNHSKKYDIKKLFKKVLTELGKTNSGQAMFLKNGIPSFIGESGFGIAFSKENQNLCSFVNKSETISLIENILKAATSQDFNVEIKIEEESFSDLDILEKTKRIINDGDVKIIEE